MVRVWCLLSVHHPRCGACVSVCGGSGACLVVLCCGLWNGGGV